jgi:hypothetical protein
MGRVRWIGSVLLLVALARCGGGDSSPQLADGSSPPAVPAALESLDDAVLTRMAVKRESELDRSEYDACGVARDSGDRTVIERTGVNGSSLTIASGRLVYACDKIPDLLIVEDDPDMPYGNIWCAAANGRIDEDGLNDPRLSLCTNADDELTGFAWVEPQPGTKWIVVSDAGYREAYEVAESLPVRVTTTDGVQQFNSNASFAIEEYAGDGSKLREYVLETAVAG